MTKFLTKICCAALLLACLPCHAITLRFAPTSQFAATGSPVSAALVISGLGEGAAPSLGTFDLDVSFDPAILSFGSAIFGNQLDILGLGSIQALTLGLGVINLFELSLDLPSDLDTLQAGSFTLAFLNFDALAGGTSALGISVNALGDSLGDPLLANTQNGSITVTAVPEPSTVLLVGIGLLGLVLIGSKSSRQRAGGA